ncbi:ABC transporter permease [Lactobacillus sp. DCY120]|uniref:ABC transporter permease n=1 Tax=Bombilactobacillus apium TaxID=2675299 RepID=A0A850QVP9_9LACO|nr:ABC transporter permease [Bombilactobacillus apium]NVY95864.1 ABC transporter permease [Bombilactobacillus apium]
MLSNKKGKLLLLPGLIIVLLFLIGPLLLILGPTLSGENTNNSYWGLISNYSNLKIIGRTFFIAIITTFVTLILGFTVAFWINNKAQKKKRFWTILILFPILTNAIVRNFTWIIILGKNGILNNILIKSHLIVTPLPLLYTSFSIVIGSVYLFLPIMITTLLSSLEELDPNLEAAASICGAKPAVILRKIILPQLRVGILTGLTLVFAGAMTAYTTPQILGGNRSLVLSTLIYQQAMTLGDWTQASRIALILIVITLCWTGGMHYLMRRRKGLKHV